ncbi:ribonuclease H-like protein, partial [Coprinellus micaceus]
MRKAYGPVYVNGEKVQVYVDGEKVQVYVDGSCTNNGNAANAQAGSGVVFGPGNWRNVAVRVPGEQTNNRGEAFAALQAILACDVHKHLEIFSDSEFVIRSLTHWLATRVSTGWGEAAQGDLFDDIVWLIRRRPAPVSLRKVKAHSGNAHDDGADALAKQGAA